MNKQTKTSVTNGEFYLPNDNIAVQIQMNVFATHLPVVRPSAFRLSQQQQNKQNSKPWQQEVALDNVISAARKRNAAAAGG